MHVAEVLSMRTDGVMQAFGVDAIECCVSKMRAVGESEHHTNI